MENLTKHVLKSKNVKFEGKLQLNQPWPQSTAAAPVNKSTQRITPQANIVEKHPDFALIEVTCACGNKMYLKCQYSSEQTTDSNIKQESQVGEKKNANQ